VKLSERSEFASFPILRPAQLGIPQGQRLCGAFFGIPFLAKQKRYVVAGLPPACNRTTTTEVKTKPDHKNTSKPSAHIPRASQANMFEEAHGICALAGCDFRLHAKRKIRPITLR
jgi:hypothetical protein